MIPSILNATLPEPYYARLESRPEIGIIGHGPVRRVVPDVSVQRGTADAAAGTVVLATARTEVSPYVEVLLDAEAVRHPWIEIRDSAQLFPFNVPEPLPCVPVPLRQGEPEPALDLQFALAAAWLSGPYRRGGVDYAADPDPPLPEEQRLQEMLRA